MATNKPKTRQPPLALQLAETGTVDAVSKPPDKAIPQFSRRLVHLSDREAAVTLIKEQATFEADRQFGATLAQVKLDIEDIDAKFRTASRLLNDLETKKANTARHIRNSALHSTGKKEAADIRWQDWRRKDQILLCVLLSSLVIAAVLGMGNVYANLIASGNTVFIEKPWIALMISALMPIASVSVKYVTNFMTFDSSRRLYAKCLYAATGIAFLCWGALFGLIHTGVAGSIDWESFGEAGTDFGPAFIWSQLLVEMLAASALFLAVEDIYMRYSPDAYIENPEYIEIEKALKEQQATHEALREQRGRLYGRRVELEAQHAAFINERIVEYISLRARHIATMNAYSDH